MAKRQLTTVCVVLPAFNEASVIRSVLKKLPRSARILGQTVQLSIVVVDDGSTDTTAKIARSVPGITVISHLINMGAGAATRTGLHYARNNKFNFAVTMDADGQHAPADLRKLLEVSLENSYYDLVIGSRLENTGNMPLSKQVGNRILSFCTYLLLGSYVTDSQSGFRVFSKSALDNLEFHSNGYGFCSEMLWQAKRLGLRIREVPIQAIYTDYSLAKGQKNYSGTIQILQQLLLRRILGY